MKYSWDGEAMASASEYLRGEFEERAARAGGRFGQRLEATHGARMLEGEQRLVNCENALENVMCWKRHRFQREFHDRCLASLAKLIVGDKDWEAVGERICRERNWDTDASICAAAAARRFGKSVAVADLAAVLAVFGPRKLRQGIFSPGRRQSRYLGEIIYSTLVESGFKHMITVYNQEEMWIVPDPNKPDDIRKIFYFPASSHVRIARRAHAATAAAPIHRAATMDDAEVPQFRDALEDAAQRRHRDAPYGSADDAFQQFFTWSDVPANERFMRVVVLFLSVMVFVFGLVSMIQGFGVSHLAVYALFTVAWSWAAVTCETRDRTARRVFTTGVAFALGAMNALSAFAACLNPNHATASMGVYGVAWCAVAFVACARVYRRLSDGDEAVSPSPLRV